MLMIAGVIVAFAVNITVLTVTARNHPSAGGISRTAVSLVSPFQYAVTKSMGFVEGIWRSYFHLVAVARENTALKKELAEAKEKSNQCSELALSNRRLRTFLNLAMTMDDQAIAAEVIGRDPSPWFKTLMIDKGSSDGLTAGMAVVVSEGVAGQVVDVSPGFAKVMLITDRSSAVDALVQRTRARGVIKGEAADHCFFKYALRKHDIRIGDTIVSSGLDGVYPKGLRIGTVSHVVKNSAGIFQEVRISPFVDFEKIEEVLVVVGTSGREP